jgi:hypothetical protein
MAMPAALGRQAQRMSRGQAGQPGERQAARDAADHSDPVRAQAESAGRGDAEQEDDERPRQTWPASHREQRDERDGAQGGGRETGLVEVSEIGPENLEEAGRRDDVQAEKIGHLAGDDGQGEASDVAGDHRAGEELRDEAQAGDAGDQHEEADQAGDHGDQSERLGRGPGAVSGHHRGRHDGGGRGRRAHELPRGAKERIDGQAGQRGVEASLRRHPRDLRVGQALRQQQADHGEGGDRVVAQPATLVAARPGRDRQVATQPAARRGPRDAGRRGGRVLLCD